MLLSRICRLRVRGELLPSKKHIWPSKKAVLISYSDSATPHIRGLLREFNWVIVKDTSDPNEAISLIEEGEAYMLLIQHSSEMPSLYTLRLFLTHSIAPITPTVLFLDGEHHFESESLRSLPQAGGLAKPMSPARFGPVMQSLIVYFESQPLVAFRNCVYSYRRSQDTATFIKFLDKLSKIDGLGELCAVYRAQILRDRGDILGAERVLLQRIKLGGRCLNAAFQLLDLYLKFSQPGLAYKLIQSIQRTIKGSLFVYPDLVQTSMMLGNYDEAIGAIKLMRERKWLTGHLEGCLVPLYMALGLPGHAQKEFLKGSKAFRDLVEGWKNAG